MTFTDGMEWLEARPFATAIAESEWLFPALEVVHVVALTLVVGSIAVLDLRLLGVSRKNYGVLQLSAQTLPWTWAAFSIAAISGVLLFSSAATSYIDNVPFRIKLLLILLAGINMAVFHLTAFRHVRSWDRELPTPIAARVAGTLSLAFWICVVFLGRWIGFV